jgi:hypothetical protein
MPWQHRSDESIGSSHTEGRVPRMQGSEITRETCANSRSRCWSLCVATILIAEGRHVGFDRLSAHHLPLMQPMCNAGWNRVVPLSNPDQRISHLIAPMYGVTLF